MEKKNSKDEHKFTNSLISETSPYLLQHAHNPVNWMAWNDSSLARAKRENKLILVSIGYSACHWCHVMEHESFEDTSVAEIMNDNFICIKVDREERPDIDQVYMAAVQLMTGRGGWPLNCFCLPDGKPVYGGTYFPKDKWKDILLQMTEGFTTEPAKFYEYAEELTNGVNKMELVKLNSSDEEFSFVTVEDSVRNWRKKFDTIEGGQNYSPKFPMPNNYDFLLQYAITKNDKEILKQVELTLTKMGMGGIYDQIGGGFARYSTDILWKAPHFEKMLYDNAQLVSLYSNAYRVTKNDLYKNVVYETLEFVLREMTNEEGAFYSALDADTDGEEGKYYVWKKEELGKLLGEKFNLFAEYYSVNSSGLWEHGNYILLRRKTEQEICNDKKITIDVLRKEINGCKQILFSEREKRNKPGLDDKTLCSWNALMAKGFIDAYNSFGEKKFLASAEKNISFILSKMKRTDGGLFHSYKNGKSTINGYLEDYSFVIESLIALYQTTFEEKYLNEAKSLTDYCVKHFFDKKSGMFFFTSDVDAPLIARKMETSDNVIPASNSSMAKSLFLLSHYYNNADYLAKSKQMLRNVEQFIGDYTSGYSNWAQLLIWFTQPFYEVAIVGNSVDEMKTELNKLFLPNLIFAGSKSESSMALLENRFVKNKTMIYVCENQSCKLPVENVEKALLLMK